MKFSLPLFTVILFFHTYDANAIQLLSQASKQRVVSAHQHEVTMLMKSLDTCVHETVVMSGKSLSFCDRKSNAGLRT